MNDQTEVNEKLLVNFQGGHKIFYNNAAPYSYPGNKKLAFKYLKKFDGTNRWESNIYLIQMDPLFDNIREEPEIKSMIHKELEINRKIREEIARLEAEGELRAAR